MGRPQYESQGDRDIEQSVAAFMVTNWKLDEAKKLPKSYGLDWALIRDGSLVGYAEFKDRPTLPFGFKGGFFVAMHKVISAHLLTATSGLPCVLLAQFKEREFGYWNFNEHAAGVAWGGRKDRKDAADLEPMGVYPWHIFKRLA